MRNKRIKVSSDSGSAMLEFIVVGIGIVMPLVYLAITVMTLHAASFAAHAGAREAARVFMASPSIAQGNGSAVTAMQQAFIDHGVDSSASDISVTCTNGMCLSPGSLLTVEVTSDVPLPFIPRWGDSAPLTWPVDANVTLLVDKFRQAG